MLRDEIRDQRIAMNWRWSEEEIALLQAGLPTPNRSEMARKKKRLSLGIHLKQPCRTSAPYRPPLPRPSGHIPWPRWWDRAHALRRAGYGPTEIASILGKNRFTVSSALYPDVKERCALNTKRFQHAVSKDPERRTLDSKRAKLRDGKRLQIRRLAREEWREGGGEPSALERYYRKYECL